MQSRVPLGSGKFHVVVLVFLIMFTLSYFLLQGKVLCFGTYRQVACKMFIKHSENLVKKITSRVIFDTHCTCMALSRKDWELLN